MDSTTVILVLGILASVTEARYIRSEESSCWPSMLSLLEQLQELPGELALLSPGNANEAFVCRMAAVENIGDLAELLNVTEEDMTHKYFTFQLYLHIFGGLPTVYRMMDTVQLVLQKMVETDFPSLPVQGYTQQEIADFITDVRESMRPLEAATADLNGDIFTMAPDQIANALLTSNNLEEFANRTDIPLGVLRRLEQSKPQFPAYQRALVLYRALMQELDSAGWYNLPEASESNSEGPPAEECWPELERIILEMMAELNSLSPESPLGQMYTASMALMSSTSHLDFTTEEGIHQSVCAASRVQSIDDLADLYKMPPGVVKKFYGRFIEVYRRIGGIEFVREMGHAIEDTFTWMIANDFPRVPLTGVSVEEAVDVFMRIVTLVERVTDVGDPELMRERVTHVINALVESNSLEELDSHTHLAGISHTISRVMTLKPDFPVLKALVPLEVESFEQLDLRGWFRFPLDEDQN